jgi:hypothetical protein
MKRNNMDNEIDLDFSLIDSQQLFDVIDFIDNNRDEIINDIKGDVLRFLENKDDFNDIFGIFYSQAFTEFVIKQIHEILANHFEEINREDMLAKYDKEFFAVFGFDDLLLKETYE